MGRMPLDLDFLEFTCTQEFVFLNAVSSQVAVCPAILDALTQLHSLINIEKEKSKQHIAVMQFQGRTSWATTNGHIPRLPMQPS